MSVLPEVDGIMHIVARSPYLLHLCPDEEIQLPTETQHLQAHLLRTQPDRHQRSPHLQLH